MPQTIVSGHMLTPKTKRSRKLRLLKAVVKTVLMVVVFIAGFFANVGLTALSQHNAKQVTHDFITTLNSGDNAKAYSYTSANFHVQQSQDQFGSLVGDLKSDQTSYTCESISYNGSIASYAGVEDGLPKNAEGNTTRTFSLALVKHGPLGWKIDSVSIN